MSNPYGGDRYPSQQYGAQGPTGGSSERERLMALETNQLHLFEQMRGHRDTVASLSTSLQMTNDTMHRQALRGMGIEKELITHQKVLDDWVIEQEALGLAKRLDELERKANLAWQCLKWGAVGLTALATVLGKLNWPAIIRSVINLAV